MAEEAILGFLKNNDEIQDSGEFAVDHDLDHEQVKNVIKSLQGFGYIEAKVPYHQFAKMLRISRNDINDGGESPLVMCRCLDGNYGI